MRVRYLDFAGESDLDEQTIIDDFISVNIFYQYFINNKMKIIIIIKLMKYLII